jgi:hypothetical protein
MEGENYILSSSYWGAVRQIEEAIKPHVGDSQELASVRAAMFADHFNNRVTLEQSTSAPLHVLMHLLDPRSQIAFFAHPFHFVIVSRFVPMRLDGVFNVAVC